VEPDENLYCTPNGSIRDSQQGQTVFSLLLRKQAQLPPERPAPATPSELPSYRSQMEADIRKLLRYQHSDQPVAPRLLVTTPRKGYRIEKLEFISEPGIYVSAWVFLPNAVRERRVAILYVNDAGKESEGMEFEVLEGLALKGEMVVAVDVRGIGATRPSALGEARDEYQNLEDVELALTYCAWEMDEELFGMRVQDVIRSVDYVLSRPDVNPEGVKLIGKGMGALWALYAAALDTRIRAVVCAEGLLSYHSLTNVDRYRHEASIFIRDVLKYLDLPQVAGAVADRPLAILSPVDALKAPVEMSEAHLTYRWTEKVYTNLGVGHRFRLSSHDPETTPADEYLALLAG
jgi:pimeloyl-ACP methyl ester carboxylesterase